VSAKVDYELVECAGGQRVRAVSDGLGTVWHATAEEIAAWHREHVAGTLRWFPRSQPAPPAPAPTVRGEIERILALHTDVDHAEHCPRYDCDGGCEDDVDPCPDHGPCNCCARTAQIAAEALRRLP
jgi:hypothetical protein